MKDPRFSSKITADLGIEVESSDSQTSILSVSQEHHKPTAGQWHEYKPGVVVEGPTVSETAPSLGQRREKMSFVRDPGSLEH